MSLIHDRLAEHIAVIRALDALEPDIARLADLARLTLSSGGRLLLFGNGGSAADAQHIAAELVGRYQRERRGLAAIALTTDTSILTSVGNDYGFEHIYTRQVEALADPHDLVIGLSTSGNSRNVQQALEAASQRGCTTAALLGGDGGSIRDTVRLALVVPSPVTARVQEAHILIGHILCELIEAE